jgi:hypothetical protein
MEQFFRWRNPRSDEDLSLLDSYLQRTLIPVSPSQHFVHDLQSRLLREAFSPEGLRTTRIFQYMLVTTSVLAGVSMLMITGIRVMIGILGFMGLVQKISSQRKS